MDHTARVPEWLAQRIDLYLHGAIVPTLANGPTLADGSWSSRD